MGIVRFGTERKLAQYFTPDLAALRVSNDPEFRIEKR